VRMENCKITTSEGTNKPAITNAEVSLDGKPLK